MRELDYLVKLTVLLNNAVREFEAFQPSPTVVRFVIYIIDTLKNLNFCN